MKKPLIIVSAIILFTSCERRIEECRPTALPLDYIPVDSANKMLTSYLNSIHASVNDTDVRSWSIDVDQLRLMIDSADKGNAVKHLKIMLSHKLEYINSGHGNEKSGYNKNAMTIIIAGYDSLGNYIFTGSDAVLNRARPCPSNCPPGDAGNNLITY